MTSDDGLAQHQAISATGKAGPVTISYIPHSNVMEVRSPKGMVIEQRQFMSHHAPLHMDGLTFVWGKSRYEVNPADQASALVFVAATNYAASEWNSGAAPQMRAGAMHKLTKSISYIRFIAVAILIVGVVGGIAMMSYSGGSRFDESSPYAGVGAATIAGAIVQAALLWFLASWADAWRSVHEQS